LASQSLPGLGLGLPGRRICTRTPGRRGPSAPPYLGELSDLLAHFHVHLGLTVHSPARATADVGFGAGASPGRVNFAVEGRCHRYKAPSTPMLSPCARAGVTACGLSRERWHCSGSCSREATASGAHPRTALFGWHSHPPPLAGYGALRVPVPCGEAPAPARRQLLPLAAAGFGGLLLADHSALGTWVA
jgi:hypothetical protein